MRRLFLLGSLALAGCGSGAPAIRVSDAWSRPTAAREDLAEGGGPTAPGVVYLTIENTGDGDDRLLSVRTSACASPELHRSVLVDDRMRMELVEDGIAVPAGGRVVLEPGGLHVMLLGLNDELYAGERFMLELVFERSGSVAVESEVRGP